MTTLRESNLQITFPGMQIVADCMVFNIDTWNRHLPRFPLSRIR